MRDWPWRQLQEGFDAHQTRDLQLPDPRCRRPVTFNTPRSLRRISVELPEELLAAIDARKESMQVARRGEVLTGLLDWMVKDPSDEGAAT